MEQNPNPYPILDELRQRDPPHDDVLHRHVRTRHEDMDAVLKDRRGAVDPRNAAPFDGNGGRMTAITPGRHRPRSMASDSVSPTTT